MNPNKLTYILHFKSFISNKHHTFLGVPVFLWLIICEFSSLPHSAYSGFMQSVDGFVAKTDISNVPREIARLRRNGREEEEEDLERVSMDKNREKG